MAQGELSDRERVRAAEVISGLSLATDLGIGVSLEAAGKRAPPIERPTGLTDRESEVIALLARGWQTKQIARELDISPNTADRHIQHAYRKMGVSTRAAAALFAMEHGLLAWGEFTIGKPADRQ